MAGFLEKVLLDKPLADTDGKIWREGAAGGKVQGEWVQFDLQDEVIGSGAPMNLYYDDSGVALQRLDNSLIFRIRAKERNWRQRFRDRWR